MIECSLAEALMWQCQRSEAGTGEHGVRVSGRDVQSLNLEAEWEQDRTKWNGLFGGTVQPIPAWKTDSKPMMMMMMMEGRVIYRARCLKQ